MAGEAVLASFSTCHASDQKDSFFLPCDSNRRVPDETLKPLIFGDKDVYRPVLFGTRLTGTHYAVEEFLD